MRTDNNSSARSAVTGVLAGLVGLIGLAGLVASSAWAAGNPVFVHATQLNLRAAPAANARSLALLKINDALDPVPGSRSDGTWCEVQTQSTDPAQVQRGWVQCSFVSAQLVGTESLQRDWTQASVEVLKALGPNGIGSGQYSGSELASRSAVLQNLERLFATLERKFALSPSIHTLAKYDELLMFTGVSQLKDTPAVDAEKQPLAALGKKKLPELARMRKALQNPEVTLKSPPDHTPVSDHFSQLLAQKFPARRAAKKARAAAGEADSLLNKPVTPSLFSGGRWVTGWAGDPLISRVRDPKDSSRLMYFGSTDFNSYAELGDIFEMAKAYKAPVKLSFAEAAFGGLSQDAATADNGPRAMKLDMNLPVWAVTKEGLIKGELQQASYHGGVCAGSDEGAAWGTGITFKLEKLPRSPILGVFATNASIEPEHAKVHIQGRTNLEGLGDGFENTLTHRVLAVVDLDGDGIPDLRTLVKQDSAVARNHVTPRSSSSALAFMDGSASHTPRHPWLRPVAGWYAFDVYMIQANQDGRWSTLNLYAVVTCT